MIRRDKLHGESFHEKWCWFWFYYIFGWGIPLILYAVVLGGPTNSIPQKFANYWAVGALILAIVLYWWTKP